METKTKVHITRCKVDGPKLDKNNKQYWRVGIQTREHGEKWFNCNYFPFNPDRWENTDQDVILYDEEYQGKMFSKFKLPPRETKGGGLSTNDQATIKKAAEYAYAANTNVLNLIQLLKQSGVIKTEKKDDYTPASPTAFDDDIPEGEIDPRDIIPEGTGY